MAEEFQTIEMREIREWNFNDFLNFSIMQTLKSASEDIIKFSICVDNIEALLVDELEDNKKYNNVIKEKWDKLDEEYGEREQNKAIKLKEFASFKFKELLKIIKSKIPQEKIGVLV